MNRYIDAELIEKYISREEHNTPDEKWRPESEFAALVDNVPTADVVEVVRCWGCVSNRDGFCNFLDRPITENDYCSYGKKVE